MRRPIVGFGLLQIVKQWRLSVLLAIRGQGYILMYFVVCRLKWNLLAEWELIDNSYIDWILI